LEFEEMRDCVFKAKDANVTIYAKRELFEAMKGDRTFKQIENVSHLPGLEGNAMVMPDGHEGYSFQSI